MTENERKYQEAIEELKNKADLLGDDYEEYRRMRLTAYEVVKETKDYINSKKDMSPVALEFVYQSAQIGIQNMINVIDQTLDEKKRNNR